MTLKATFTFIEFLSVFISIKRANKIKGKDDFENDAEHSYQLAMVVWYLAEVLKLKVSQELILKYALVHDLVEVYAGDTDVFALKNINEIELKSVREKKAQERIRNEFPKFGSLHSLINSYEERADPESKLVYIIDKLLPEINVFLSGDTYYKDNKVTQEAWEVWFRGRLVKKKIEEKEILDFVDQLIEFQKKQDIFYVE